MCVFVRARVLVENLSNILITNICQIVFYVSNTNVYPLLFYLFIHGNIYFVYFNIPLISICLVF